MHNAPPRDNYFFLISFNATFLLSAMFRTTSAAYELRSFMGSEGNFSLDRSSATTSRSSGNSNRFTATQKKFFLRPSL